MRASLAALLLLGALTQSAAADVAGRSRAIDGDTIELGRLTLRLYGVDAPEADQTCGAADGGAWACGAAARTGLADLIAGRDLRCAAIEHDGYGRVVARCAADGRDLGAALVAAGLAWANTRFTRDYAAAEAEARAAARGVWQGPAIAAWDWRSTQGFRPAAGVAPADTAAAEGCAIKGNVSATGERIYHTPSSRWHARVRIAPAEGERWFCSEAEAEAAGWRPASERLSKSPVLTEP